MFNPVLATGETKEEALVNGATRFLADRAKANAEYMFELRVKNNKLLRCYLPNIGGAIKNYEFSLLLKTNGKIWKQKLAEDIKFDTLLFLLSRLDKLSAINKENSSAIAKDLIPMLTGSHFIESSHANHVRPIHTVKVDIKNTILRLDEIKSMRDSGLKPCAYDVRIGDYKAVLITLAEILSNLEISRSLDESLPAVSTEDLLQAMSDVDPASESDVQTKKKLMVIATTSEIYESLSNKDVDDYSYISAMTDLLYLANLFDTPEEKKDGALDNIKNNMMFFASLADAKSSSEVAATLEAFMLPPVSFGEKRQNTHVHITSYIGADLTYSYNKRERVPLGVYVPLGIEASTPVNDGGVVGVMFSPFDFGYPLDLKESGSNSTVGLSDVVNPSISISYGWKDYPANWGIAWQRVNKNQFNNQQGNRLLLFVSFDMPLFVLY